MTDAEVLPNLLKQIHRKIHTISEDGAFDTQSFVRFHIGIDEVAQFKNNGNQLFKV